MNNEYYMGGPMPYRANGYAPSYLSTYGMQPQMNNTNTNIVWTMGLESAKAYPLMPGRTVLLMDSETPRFFIKTVDNNGYAALKAYTFQEEPTTPVAKGEEPDYVTRAQFEAAMANVMNELRQKSSAPVETAKQEAGVEVEKTKPKNLL